MFKILRFYPMFLALLMIFYPLKNALGAENMQNLSISIKIGDKELNAILEDNESSRDFYNILPLTLTLSDYNGSEKISNLPRKISTKNAASSLTPKKGDITYFAPWGNLAIFYKDFRTSSGLVKLGQIDGDLSLLMQSKDFSITIIKKQ